jgi:excisionase family DNA binding protein
MSSNIKAQRICQRCGKEFTARTTVTRYCGDDCAKRAYKARQRAAKVELCNIETQVIKAKPIEKIKAKEFLTVRDVSILLNSSLRTVYRLIAHGHIKAVNISQRKTLIMHSEIDKLFKQPAPPQTEPAQEELTKRINSVQFDISECYNFDEIQSKYGISETELQQLIQQNEIPKIKLGWYAYVPKTAIDKLFN